MMNYAENMRGSQDVPLCGKQSIMRNYVDFDAFAYSRFLCSVLVALKIDFNDQIFILKTQQYW